MSSPPASSSKALEFFSTNSLNIEDRIRRPSAMGEEGFVCALPGIFVSFTSKPKSLAWNKKECDSSTEVKREGGCVCYWLFLCRNWCVCFWLQPSNVRAQAEVGHCVDASVLDCCNIIGASSLQLRACEEKYGCEAGRAFCCLLLFGASEKKCARVGHGGMEMEGPVLGFLSSLLPHLVEVANVGRESGNYGRKGQKQDDETILHFFSVFLMAVLGVAVSLMMVCCRSIKLE
ncbi:Pectate lyase P59 precursor [Actinidia chinensis var. chinensis]|uniref:Pectate lyase P59 n=1 Tax=Actinidia chinensis var. chinensis TaxID=1590841 RepID=A0A2R6RYR5_ACTCC|nr:Pectate lyase P59 precursor [Actinidia chinensis var. chinensis]